MHAYPNFFRSLSAAPVAIAFMVGAICRGGTAMAATEATDVLEEVVVTAEHRTENAQNTAASVSVRSGDDLREEGKYLLRDILENIPGVNGGQLESAGTVAGGGTDTAGAGIVIRGIRSNLGSGGNITSSASAVALYTDDVYEGIGSNYDLDRVEVLRGPQGTLYGRSATGGVVAVHTRNPDLATFGGYASVEGGNYDLRHYSGAVNIPVIDDELAVRLSGDYFHRNGFDTDNGLGDRTNKNARVKVLFKPTDQFTLLVGAALQDNEDATGGRSPQFDASGNLIFADSPVGAGSNKFRQFWANAQLDLGFATLTYIPSYRRWEQDALNVGVGPGILILQTLKTPTDNFLTHELRLSSNGSDGLKWQVGALTYKNNLSNSNSIRFATGPLAFAADTHKDTSAFGVFGEVTVPIAEAWRVTGGLRYDRTKVAVAQDYENGNPPVGPSTFFSLPNGSDDGRRSFKNWTYKLRGEHDLSPQNLLYASYSTGFSPGDVTVTNDPAGQPYVLDLKDQTLRAYEIGSKNRFLGNTLQLNGSLYHYNYSGYQNAGIDIDERGGFFLAFATLVSPVEINGGEAELLYQPTAKDRVALNLAYTDARYVDSPAFFKQFVARDHVADVPPFTADLAYSHRFDLPGGSHFAVAADARYLSAHDAGTITQLAVSYGGAPLIREDALVLANLNATWTSTSGMFTVGGYVRNITDKRYSTLTETSLTTPPPTFDPIGISGGTYKLTEPRTFGAIVAVNF